MEPPANPPSVQLSAQPQGVGLPPAAPQREPGFLDKKIVRVALYTLAGLAIGVGIVGGAGGLAGGVYFMGKMYLGSALGAKIFAATAVVFYPMGTVMLYLSGALLAGGVTALGAAFTLPAAGVCFGVPFAPALVGAVGCLPGVGLAAAGFYGIDALNERGRQLPGAAEQAAIDAKKEEIKKIHEEFPAISDNYKRLLTGLQQCKNSGNAGTIEYYLVQETDALKKVDEMIAQEKQARADLAKLTKQEPEAQENLEYDQKYEQQVLTRTQLIIDLVAFIKPSFEKSKANYKSSHEDASLRNIEERLKKLDQVVEEALAYADKIQERLTLTLRKSGINVEAREKKVQQEKAQRAATVALSKVAVAECCLKEEQESFQDLSTRIQKLQTALRDQETYVQQARAALEQQQELAKRAQQVLAAQA